MPINKEDFIELIERFDSRYVKREDCDERHEDINGKLSHDDKRLAVIEYQQKVNNWLTTVIAGGIIALVVKIFLGG